MADQSFSLEITGVSSAEAGIYAKELKELLLDTSKEVKVELKRRDEKAQDFGSTLLLVLGAPAVVIAAQAIRDWMNLRSKVNLKMVNPNGEKMEGENLTGKDATEIARIFRNRS